MAIALPLAVSFSATADVNFEPDALQAVVAVAGVAGLLAVGFFGGRWSLPMFAAVYVTVAVIHEAFLWTDDPNRDGWENFPPTAGIVLILPFLLIAVLAGVAVGGVVRRRRERAALRGPPGLPEPH